MLHTYLQNLLHGGVLPSLRFRFLDPKHALALREAMGRHSFLKDSFLFLFPLPAKFRIRNCLEPNLAVKNESILKLCFAAIKKQQISLLEIEINSKEIRNTAQYDILLK